MARSGGACLVGAERRAIAANECPVMTAEMPGTPSCSISAEVRDCDGFGA
jgi:hypothetical protein